MFSLDLVVSNHPVKNHVTSIINNKIELGDDFELGNDKVWFIGYSDEFKSDSECFIFEFDVKDNGTWYDLTLTAIKNEVDDEVKDLDINPTIVKEVTSKCQTVFDNHFPSEEEKYTSDMEMYGLRNSDFLYGF